MFLTTPDATAILGYAGLGATASGVQPSDWMSEVLRDRKLLLAESLGILAKAANDQLPKHLTQFPKQFTRPIHNIVVVALKADGPQLYTIDILLEADRRSFASRYTRYEAKPKPYISLTPRIYSAGSGSEYVVTHRTRLRCLLNIIKAHDQMKVSAKTVSDVFARINYDAFLDDKNGFISPNCVVTWRYSKKSAHGGGGGQLNYTDFNRDNSNSVILPGIANGMDVRQAVKISLPFIRDNLIGSYTNKEAFMQIIDGLNSNLPELPDSPDRELR